MKDWQSLGWFSCLSSSILMLLGCTEERDLAEPPMVFADVSPIFDESCVGCHGGEDPAADYGVEDYFTTIRCIPDPEGQPATLPSDETAPILAVLKEPMVHAELLDASETETLTSWVVQGAVPDPRSTHPGPWNDPRSIEWHGSYLRDEDWQPIVDPTRTDACGLCHSGSPAPVESVVRYPDDATDCTDCHDLPGGVMACGTCHGDGKRSYPPRDQCYFRGPPEGYSHEPHVEPSPNNWAGLDCETCHYDEDFTMLEGKHGNSVVDVEFDPIWGPDASYDFENFACATTCHIRGGTAPEVAWNERALDLRCNACHQNPPPAHPSIPCNNCHIGINPAGTVLPPEAPHINGRVDTLGGIGAFR